jgi:hypothetical protein
MKKIKSIVTIIVSILLLGCSTGKEGSEGKAGKDGATGKDGSNGKDGKNGSNGKDGTDNRIIASIHCSGKLQGWQVNVMYDVSVLASGDVYAYAATSNSLQQIGASVFYSVKQVGANSAAVIFTDDYEKPSVASWWEVSLNRDTLITTVKYHSSTTTTWTMTSDKCIKNSY